ncbi:hypothetical protein BC826DRAFT_970181 [Russula brevipes]|nr:hypothetical protein BC826DRAFT_970181 [Russula brevipes]
MALTCSDANSNATERGAGCNGRTHSKGYKQPKHAARTPTHGDNPRDTGSPHGPRERPTEHTSVAQAKGTRDTQTRTGALALSEAIARTAKGKSPTMKKRTLLGAWISTKPCHSPRKATGKPRQAQRHALLRSAQPVSKGPTVTATSLWHALQGRRAPQLTAAIATELRVRPLPSPASPNACLKTFPQQKNGRHGHYQNISTTFQKHGLYTHQFQAGRVPSAEREAQKEDDA